MQNAFHLRPPDFVLDPTYHLPFDETPNAVSLVFVPERDVVLVHLHVPVLNLWRLVVSIWPELMAIVGGLLLLIALWLGWRVLSRRRAAGEPYCRKCNYHLVKLADDMKCPECGKVVAKARVLGKRMRWRLATPAVLSILALAMLVIPIVVALPRDMAIANRFFFDSPGLLAWAEKNKIEWIVKHKSRGDRVVEVDLTTGEVARTLIAQGTPTYYHMGFNSDRTRVFLLTDGQALAAYSTSTGERVASTFVAGSYQVGGEIRRRFVLPADSPDAVYFTAVDHSVGMSELYYWQLESQPERIIATPAYDSGNHYYPRNFTTRETSAGKEFLTWPGFTEAYNESSCRVELFDDKGSRLREYRIEKGLYDPNIDVALHPDGNKLFVPSNFGRGITILDLETGDTERGSYWPRMANSRSIETHPAGRYLLGGFSDFGSIKDVDTGTIIARFNAPSHLYGAEFFVEGRWLGAVMQGARTSPTEFAHEVVIWDLSPLLENEP